MADVFLRAAAGARVGSASWGVRGTLGLAAVWAGAAADFTAEMVADAWAARVSTKCGGGAGEEKSSPAPLSSTSTPTADAGGVAAIRARAGSLR